MVRSDSAFERVWNDRLRLYHHKQYLVSRAQSKRSAWHHGRVILQESLSAGCSQSRLYACGSHCNIVFPLNKKTAFEKALFLFLTLKYWIFFD